MDLVNRVRKAAVPIFIASTIAATSVLGACDWGNAPTVVNPPASEDHVSNNSYDLGKSLGLEAEYLIELNFDDNAKDFINYLASVPKQMRTIAEDSGLTEKLIADKQITGNETEYFKKLIGSYQNEIEIMQPWLNQLSKQEATEALALNLSNFLEVSKDEMFYNLDSDVLPSLLPRDLFVVDGVKRKYAAEVIDPDGWGRTIKPYASIMVENIENFNDIHAKAWEVANNPDYRSQGFSIEENLSLAYFELEAVGSTDAGVNAYEDIRLLLESGGPEAKAALRLYARNLTREGRQGSAEQVRVELTGIDTWSIGTYSHEVRITGHDVPAIRITDEDITLLKSRSADPLLILDIGNKHYLPLQWTRKSILKNDVDVINLYQEAGAENIKISDLKPY